MPASITTVLQLDDKDLKSKLESVSKYYNETYKNWANSTEKVNQKSKELISQKEKLASAVSSLNEEIKKGITANTATVAELQKEIASRKENIKAINAEKSALVASASLQKAELAQNKSGIDYLQKQVSARKEATSATDSHTKSTESLANTTIRYLRWAGTIAGVVYAGKRAWDATLGTGISVNKMMEDNTSGIAALLSANTQMVLSNGKVVDSYQKFAIGQGVAKDTMEQLRIASIKTYATFPQLTEIFQQAIGQTLGMGNSFGTTTDSIIANTVKLSQRMSNIAGAIGMPMDRVREEIRSLLSGNVSTDSLISTMIFGSPSQANQAINEAKKRGENGVKELLDKMLKPFDALENVDSYTKNLLALQDAWSQTMATMSKPVFEDLKEVYKGLTQSITQNQKETQEAFFKTYSIVKEIAPEVGRIAIGVGAIRIAAMVNPFTAWAVALTQIVTAVQSLATTQYQERTTKGITESISKATGGITSKSNEEDIGKAIALNIKQIEARAKSLTLLDKESMAYKTTLEAVKQLNDEVIRLEKTKEISVSKTDGLLETGKLITQIPVNAETLKDAISYNNKALEDTLKLTKEIDELNKDIEQRKKRQEALPKTSEYDTARKDIQKEISAEQDAISTKQKEIAEIKAKEYEKQQKKHQELLKAQKASRDIEADIAFEIFKQNGGSVTQLDILNKAIIDKYELLEIDKASGLENKEIQKAELEFQKSITTLIEYSMQEQLKAEKDLETEKDKARQREEKYLKEKANLNAQLIVEQEKLNSLSVIYSSKRDDITSSYVKQLADIDKQVAKINDQEILEEEKLDLLADQKKIRDTILAQQAQELDNASIFRQTMIETVDIMQDGFQDFFDFSKDGFLDLSKLAKGLGNDILGSFSKNMSSGISTSLMGSIFGAQKSEADLKSMGLSLVGDVYKGTIEGQAVEVDKSGNILSGGNLSSVVSAASGLKSASSLFSGGLSGALYAPSAGVGGLASSAYGAGYAGIGDFLSGSAATLSGGSSAGMSAAAQLGGTSTLALGGAAIGYGVGSLGDKLFGADTKAGIGGAIGGAIGTVLLPGIGTAIGSALGSALGGMFGSTKLKDQGIFAGVETSASMGLDELSRYEDYKKKSWFSSKSWTTFTDLSASEQNKIENLFQSYDYLLAQLGDFEEVSVAAGKYTKDTFQDAISKSLLSKFSGINQTLEEQVYKQIALYSEEYGTILETTAEMITRTVDNPDFTEIYSAWEDYAKEVDKTTGEAITNALSGIVTTERGFKEWALSFQDKDLEALSFKAQYLSEDFANLAKMMDAENVTVDNYTESMRKALQENLTPENISLWEQLGNSIMASSDATKAYTDALNQEQNTKNELAIQAALASANNISLFLDSLKTEKELAETLASSLGVNLATGIDELATLFYNLSEDTDGLNDAELDLLNRNKALLESTEDYQDEIKDLNITVENAGKALGSLDGALGTIQNTIEKLRAASRTSEQSLQIYYDAIADAQRLSATDLYDDFANAVSKASSATSALFETSNFQTSRDMQFAQLVAANQFEGLADITLEEIDYLKQIEINTRTQIDVLVQAMNSLGRNVSSSLSSSIAAMQSMIPEQTSTQPDYITTLVQSAYSTVLGREAEQGGLDYWTTQVKAGNIAINDINKAVAFGAQGAGDVAAATTYLSQLPKFAVGTPEVPYDMLAQIHKGEIITPATYSEGIRNGDIMMGDTSGIVGRMDKLISRIEALEETNSRHLARIEYNTTKSRTEVVA